LDAENRAWGLVLLAACIFLKDVEAPKVVLPRLLKLMKFRMLVLSDGDNRACVGVDSSSDWVLARIFFQKKLDVEFSSCVFVYFSELPVTCENVGLTL